MEKVRAFLARKNITFSAKRYFIDAMSAMAQGLFCTLLVGTILDTIGKQFGIGFLTNAFLTIKQGDIMGIGDKTILSVGQSIQDVTKDMIEQLAGDDAELISIYYGSDVTEEDANALAEAVEAVYPDVDVEVNYGGQPIYYYILSVE